ncbi:hypothetical protein Q4595_23020, partial [Wenyingzhuangia sp. 1_MG-2023]|nr:hypothetical protein [Wenyingzhuangia sp. 1_MG-2023]
MTSRSSLPAADNSPVFTPPSGLLYRAADRLYRRPNLLLALLLLPPLLWFGSVYIASLLALLW